MTDATFHQHYRNDMQTVRCSLPEIGIAPDNQWLEDESLFWMTHSLKAILVSGSAYSLLDSQKDVPGRDARFISMAKFDSEMGGRTESPSCLYITVVQDIKVCTVRL